MRLLEAYLVAIAGGGRICFVPTPAADSADAIVSFYAGVALRYAGPELAEVATVRRGAAAYRVEQDGRRR